MFDLSAIADDRTVNVDIILEYLMRTIYTMMTMIDKGNRAMCVLYCSHEIPFSAE